jgi:hypothetical protein
MLGQNRNHRSADITLEEMRSLMGERGVSTSVASLWRFFDLRGVSFKKSFHAADQLPCPQIEACRRRELSASRRAVTPARDHRRSVGAMMVAELLTNRRGECRRRKPMERRMGRNSDELARAITLLLSDSKGDFAYERALRVFQFQCWLLGTYKQTASFGHSAIIFGAAALSRRISRIRSTTRLRLKDCFVLAITRHDVEDIIDNCFATPSNIYSLLKADPFALLKRDHDEAVAIVERLNSVVEIRLRLRASGQPSSLESAWKMLPKLAPNIG